MLTTLRLAMHDARVQRDTDRLVRLVVQNLPRFPELPSLRMELVPTLLERGDVEDATTVIQRCAELELAAGRIGAAIARFRDAETLELETADWWSALFDELDRRGIAPAPRVPRRTLPSLDADRPPLTGDALISVAVELATKVPDEPWHSPRFEPLVGLEKLDAPARRDVYSALERTTVSAGDQIVPDASDGWRWWIDGVLGADAGAFEPRSGALVDPDDAPLVARTDGAWLTLAAHRRDELLDRYDLRPAIEERRQAWRARTAVVDSDVWSAMSATGRDRLRSALTGYRFERGVVVEAGDRWPAVGVVVDGSLELIDRAGDIVARVGRIRAGEWFGEALVSGDGRSSWQVRADGPVAILGVSRDGVDEIFDAEPGATGVLEALHAEREDAVRVLDTGEVELVSDTP